MAVSGRGLDEKDLDIERTTPESPQDTSPAVSEADDEYKAYKHHAGGDVDPAEQKKVLRKIDVRLIPILILLYLLQYLDKNGINYASVYGLQEGTNLHGQQYSWLSSIFYFGKHFSRPASHLRRSC